MLVDLDAVSVLRDGSVVGDGWKIRPSVTERHANRNFLLVYR
jgi:hypothetical protein